MIHQDDNGEGDSFPGAMSWKWGAKFTDGFIVSLSPGATVCYTHSSLQGLDTLKFIPAAQDDRYQLGSEISIVSGSTADIEAEKFCVDLSSS